MGSKPGGAWKVHIVSNEGGTPEAVLPGESSEWNPSWEPSGNSLVFGEPLFALNPTLHVLDLETRSEEHTSELQSRLHLVCRLLLEKKNLSISTVPSNDFTSAKETTWPSCLIAGQ